MSRALRLLRRLPTLAAATWLIAVSNPADLPVRLDIQHEAHAPAPAQP